MHDHVKSLKSIQHAIRCGMFARCHTTATYDIVQIDGNDCIQMLTMHTSNLTLPVDLNDRRRILLYTLFRFVSFRYVSFYIGMIDKYRCFNELVCIESPKCLQSISFVLVWRNVGHTGSSQMTCTNVRLGLAHFSRIHHLHQNEIAWYFIYICPKIDAFDSYAQIRSSKIKNGTKHY